MHRVECYSILCGSTLMYVMFLSERHDEPLPPPPSTTEDKLFQENVLKRRTPP